MNASAKRALAILAGIAVVAAIWFAPHPDAALGETGDGAHAKTAVPDAPAEHGGAASTATATAGDAADAPGGPGEIVPSAARAARDVRRVAGTGVPTWPAPVGKPKSTARTGSGEAAVAAELAFQALRLVGIDAEAERTWRRAIDDPGMPSNVRSDLIEDLNQEGFVDNSHPTAADLPLILARLELIERLTPLARDDNNRASFAEAYKDLLAMYVRLGGAPRPIPATGK